MRSLMVALMLAGVGMVSLALFSGCDDIFLRGTDATNGPGGTDATPGTTVDSCQGDGGVASGTESDSGGKKGTDSAGAPGALAMTLTSIGSPTWKPECAYAFAAPCGSKASAFVGAPITIQKVMPAHQYFAAQNVVGPGVAHAQYAQEIGKGLAAAGFAPASTFSAADLTAPSCVFVVVQLVPGSGAPTGSSVDFTSGPILDPAAFPLLIDGNLASGGKVVDSALDFEYPGKATLTPEPAGQGYSHVPLVFYENNDLVAAQAGSYALQVRIIDAQKQGWNVSVGFAVK